MTEPIKDIKGEELPELKVVLDDDQDVRIYGNRRGLRLLEEAIQEVRRHEDRVRLTQTFVDLWNRGTFKAIIEIDETERE